MEETVTQKTCCKETSHEGLPNNDLEQCKIQLDEWKNKYLRSLADFENFTRRMEKEKAIWLRVGQASLLKSYSLVLMMLTVHLLLRSPLTLLSTCNNGLLGLP